LRPDGYFMRSRLKKRHCEVRASRPARNQTQYGCPHTVSDHKSGPISLHLLYRCCGVQLLWANEMWLSHIASDHNLVHFFATDCDITADINRWIVGAHSSTPATMRLPTLAGGTLKHTTPLPSDICQTAGRRSCHTCPRVTRARNVLRASG